MCFNDRFLNVSESVERKPKNKPLRNLTRLSAICLGQIKSVFENREKGKLRLLVG